MRAVLFLAVLAVACNKKEGPAAAPPPPDATPAKVQLPIGERPNGPTRAACEALGERLKTLLLEGAPAPGQTPEQQAYAKSALEKMAPLGLSYCLQVAVPKEVECLTKAHNQTELAACERFRREIPPDLLERKEVLLSDCELLFDRLRQFKIEEEGANPDDIDKTRDQIVRSCVEKAKVGTVACFLASPNYAQARRCP
jgi:hypothetical protein